MIRFTKETFPKKWCVNRENNIEIIHWFKNEYPSKHFEHKMQGYLTHYPFNEIQRRYTSSYIFDGYTEITTEEFEVFILGKEITIKDKDMKYLIKFLRKLKIR
jgi:hypothetical protein